MTSEEKPAEPRRKSLYERQKSARRWIWSNLTDEAVLVYRRSAQGKDRARVFYVEAFLFTREVGREFFRMALTSRAAALAYTTLLSLIPLFVAFSGLLNRALGSVFPDFGTQLDTILNVMLPYRSAQISSHLNTYVGNAKTASWLGMIVFVIISFRLFMAVEATINQMWKVETFRGYRQRIRAYTMLLFWGPLLIGLSFTTGNSLERAFGTFIFDELFQSVLVFLVLCLAFTMLFWLVPSTKVNIRAAMIGGTVTAVLFQAVRFGFGIYAKSLVDGNLNVIYGTVGLILIFLISLEIMWVVILIGVEISYVYQNFQGLLRASEQQLADDPKLDLYFAIRAMIEIARRFETREDAPSSYRLAEEFGATDHQMMGVLRRLEDQQLVKEIGGDWTGFVPGGDPNRITVEEIVRCIEGGDREIPAPEETDPAKELVSKLFTTLDACTEGALENQTVGTLVRDLYGLEPISPS
jgi:membrane protein